MNDFGQIKKSFLRPTVAIHLYDIYVISPNLPFDRLVWKMDTPVFSGLSPILKHNNFSTGFTGIPLCNG